MKKILLLTVFTLFAYGFVQAQEDQQMKVGASVAIPTGDFGKGYSFGLQGDFSYLFRVHPVIEVGPTASLFYYAGKKHVKDALFLPFGGAVRFHIANQFSAGADLGYGIGLAPSGNDGGFYYRIKAGYDLDRNIGLLISYSGINNSGVNAGSFNLGVEFRL